MFQGETQTPDLGKTLHDFGCALCFILVNTIVMAIKKINEVEELRKLERKGIGADPSDLYIDRLTVLADEIVQEFKDKIKESTKGSGTLAQSVTSIPTKNGFEVQADFYYKFIDDGVNAAPKNSKLGYIRPLVTGSPYSFKHLGVGKGMFEEIRSIVPGDDAKVYAVAVSIKKHGIKPHDITDNVITDELTERISEDLATLTGLAVQVVFEKNTEDFK